VAAADAQKLHQVGGRLLHAEIGQRAAEGLPHRRVGVEERPAHVPDDVVDIGLEALHPAQIHRPRRERGDALEECQPIAAHRLVF